jgi:hypothetical protein
MPIAPDKMQPKTLADLRNSQGTDLFKRVGTFDIK